MRSGTSVDEPSRVGTAGTVRSAYPESNDLAGATRVVRRIGVDTVVELANRKAENLVEKMNQVNAGKKLVRLLPAFSKVQDWIAQAKKLPRAVSY